MDRYNACNWYFTCYYCTSYLYCDSNYLDPTAYDPYGYYAGSYTGFSVDDPTLITMDSLMHKVRRVHKARKGKIKIVTDPDANGAMLVVITDDRQVVDWDAMAVGATPAIAPLVDDVDDVSPSPTADTLLPSPVST
jgi:hypothetical protein